MSSPRQPATSRQSAPHSLWKTKPDGRTIFRHSAPLVLWWAWAAFAVINLFFLVADHLTIDSVRGMAVVLTVTGAMYACTLHPRVETDPDGVTIYNPLRDHRAPWGALEGVSLGESVEFACTRPMPQKAKKIYSWALYSSRRSRARSQTRQSIFSVGPRGASTFGPRGISSRAPAEAADLARQQFSQLMTTELDRQATEGRGRVQASGVLRSSVAWPSVAAIVVPLVFLVVAFAVS